MNERPTRWLRGALVAWIAVASAIAHAQSPPPGNDPAAEAWRARRAERLQRLAPPPTPPTAPGVESHPIDAWIESRWSAGEAASLSLCDDATFLRRVYLDLTGAIPPTTEVTRFLGDRSPTKRERLIDQLLAKPGDFAAHWTPFWEDALASQQVTSQGGIPTHGDYRDWIFASFERNKPFDLFVAELIDPTLPGRRPPVVEEILGVRYAIEYIRADTHQDALQTAANVAQVFLGTSMKCAACHDHFDNPEWPQERFLAFAGWFARRDLEKIRCEVRTGQVIPPRLPFDAPSEFTVPAEPVERLKQVAAWIVDPLNGRFAPTFVNRVWKRLLGLGLYEPVDDFRADTVVSHPELLAWLAHDFMTHEYDVKHLLRRVMTSRTYQRRYDPALADRFDPARSDAPRLFRSPTLRRLTCEQVFDSVRMACAGQLQPGERMFLDTRSTALARALGRPASRNEVTTARPDDVAIVSALELLNGSELQTLIHNSLAFAKPQPRAVPLVVVDRVYRAVLSRPATPEEKRVGSIFLTSAESPTAGLEDLYWTLLVSPEFQYLK